MSGIVVSEFPAFIIHYQTFSPILLTITNFVDRGRGHCTCSFLLVKQIFKKAVLK